MRKKATFHPCRGGTCRKATSQAELPVRELHPTANRSIGGTDPLLQTPNLVFPLSAPVVRSSNDFPNDWPNYLGGPVRASACDGLGPINRAATYCLLHAERFVVSCLLLPVDACG